jgi:LmbE family N-acetylglucosaminyl deacetylase
MTAPIFSRRDLLLQAAATAAVSETVLAAEQKPSPADQQRRLHIVCVGAHPDDPESGCGGTLARCVEAGHRVTIVYFTRGEAGIGGKTHDQAAAIRTAEAEAACKILGATPVFAGQIDGATEVNRRRKDEFHKLMVDLKPDLVLGQWPIDTHSDHRAAAILTIRSYFAVKRPFQLYFYEVAAGMQSFNFTPSVYVDISSTLKKKKAALFCHKSQGMEGYYAGCHRLMDEFRGRELSVAAAEAFVPMFRDHGKGLPW